MNFHKQVAELKPYSLKELISMYGVSKKVMNNWIKQFESELGERVGYTYNVNQVAIIFEKLGTPRLISEMRI